jgi:Tfp pilus assembly protein PilF
MLRFISLILVVLSLSGCASMRRDAERRREMAFTHRQLAEAKLSQGEVPFAIREYRKSLELNAVDPETHFGLAEAYRRKGKFEEAELHLEEAIDLRPDQMEAQLNLGVIYMLQERWDEAEALFQELADDPAFIRPSRALVNLGWAQYKSGDLTAARETLALAIQAERSNYVAHLDLGIVLYDQGEAVRAIQHFAEAVRIIQGRPGAMFGPTEAEARFRSAQAYVKLGRHSEAIAQLELAAQRGGEGEWGRKSREYLEILK